MIYQALNNRILVLGSKETQEFDAGSGTILIPDDGSRVYIHWFTDTGKMRASFTMTYATKITERVKLINANNTPVRIRAIDLG